MDNNKETWKSIKMYRIAVSDKGRIMVNGQIMDALNPKSYKNISRWYFRFPHPKTGKLINRDAANIIWRAFKSPLGNDKYISFIDGDPSNLNLENLKCNIKGEYVSVEVDVDAIKARVPKVIEQMVMKWGREEEKAKLLKDVKSG